MAHEDLYDDLVSPGGLVSTVSDDERGGQPAADLSDLNLPAKLTALDSFSTGRVEGTSGNRAIATDPATGEDVLVTTNEDDPSTTFWGEPVRHQEEIPGGVRDGPNAAEALAGIDFDPVGDAANDAAKKVAGAVLAGVVIIVSVLAFLLFGKSFAEGAGEGFAS